MSGYRLSKAALTDLDGLWLYIARDNAGAADRVVDEILTTCERLAEMPGIGHSRADLISKPMRFFSVRSYPLVYWPETKPLEIVAALHGARDVPRVLNERPEE
jgi:plasmid stabilization system protein ParE